MNVLSEHFMIARCQTFQAMTCSINGTLRSANLKRADNSLHSASYCDMI